MMNEAVQNILEPLTVFPTMIYKINKQEFVQDALDVTNEYLNKLTKQEYPVYQTEMMRSARLQPLVNFIANSTWTILDNQGYNMTDLHAVMTDCWGQSFEKGGQHMEHIHAYNTQMSAFYFLETPEDCSLMSLYDPRHTKRQINLMEKSKDVITDASEGILFKVQAGDLYFANSWLPHGFTPNNSEKPFKFIHFNLTVSPAVINTAEVV
jgi:uncharacterized protein (TIGR02466 family)